MKEGMLAEVIGIVGHNGVTIEAYLARPIYASPVGGMIVLHHAPGWDDWSKEVVRMFAYRGYAAICPHLYHRRGPGHWEDIAAAARAEGLDKAMPNDQVIGDIEGAIAYLRAQPDTNGKVGVIGFCSGGRQAYLAACEIPDLNAAIDCWGGSIVPRTDPTKPQSLSRGYSTARPTCKPPCWASSEMTTRIRALPTLTKSRQRCNASASRTNFTGTTGLGTPSSQLIVSITAPNRLWIGWRQIFSFCETHLR